LQLGSTEGKKKKKFASEKILEISEKTRHSQWKAGRKRADGGNRSGKKWGRGENNKFPPQENSSPSPRGKGKPGPT